MNEYERRLIAQQRTAEDRETINLAARKLRSRVRGEMLAGLGRPEVCFQLAGVLDELALRVSALPGGLREQAVRASVGLIEHLSQSDGLKNG